MHLRYSVLLSSNILIGPQHRLNSYSFSPLSSPRPAACLTDSSETEGARSTHGFNSNVTVLFLLHMAHPWQGLVWHCAVIALKASSIPQTRALLCPPPQLSLHACTPPQLWLHECTPLSTLTARMQPESFFRAPASATTPPLCTINCRFAL